MNVSALGFLLGAAGIDARATHATRSIGDILSSRMEESIARDLATMRQTRTIELRKVEAAVSRPARPPRFDHFYWGGCGSGRSLVAEPRMTKLPGDPVLVLGDSYLKCRSVRAASFESAVTVAAYPPEFFGNCVYEGLLVSGWIEFTDEDLLQQLFALLVETPAGPDEETDYFEGETEDFNPAEFRESTGFVPELVVTFIGDVPLTIEINQTMGRMLVRAGEKWDCYAVDPLSAAALRRMIVAERKKPGE